MRVEEDDSPIFESVQADGHDALTHHARVMCSRSQLLAYVAAFPVVDCV